MGQIGLSSSAWGVGANVLAGAPSTADLPLVGRHALVSELADRIRAGSSTLLLGAPDTGRSRLLQELQANHGGPVIHLAGATAMQAVPDLASHDEPLLVLVDDLDALPSGTVDALAAAVASAPTVAVATALAGRRLPFTWSETWSAGDWGVARLGPLAPSAVRALATHVLGAPPEPAIVTDLVHACGGQPRSSMDLLSRAVTSGCVRFDGEVWRRVAPLPVDQLAAWSDPALQDLGMQARADAELIASAAPLPVRIAAQVLTPDGQRELHRRGLTVVRGDGDASLELVQPVHAEVLRAGMTKQRRIQVARELADVHDAADLDIATLLRVARWRLDAGGWTSDRWMQAAVAARSLGHDVLAEAAARRAVDQPDRLRPLLVLSTLLHERGDLEGSRTALADARAASDDDAEPLLARLLAASAAAWAVLRGDHEQVRRLAGPVLPDDGHTPGRKACQDASHTGGELGRLIVTFDQMGDVAALRVPAEPEPSPLPLAGALERGFRLLASEEPPHERLRAASVARDAAIAEARADTGWWTAVVGRLALEAGQIDTAQRAFVEASCAARTSDPLRLAPGIQVDRALAAVVAGAPSEARAHLDVVAAGDPLPARDRLRAELVEAWLAAHHEGTEDGAALAVEVGDRARARGHLRTAVDAWHLAVRFGHPDLPLRRLRDGDTAPDHPARSRALDHAVALDGRDAAALHALALDLAAQGRVLLAAEVAAHAASAGDDRQAALARGFAAVCATARTPALLGTEPARLTPRQRAIAAAVVSGDSPRTVAGRVGLSVRTVENHLSRVYRELGLTGRAELRRVHRAGTGPFAAR